ncbi:MAG: winged helix DNA-binding domain-containing protein [Chloroflexi bacterium]|nr:winged helix DNA-binding domain-containing protein [Chloroflexota bacterium]MBI3341299.1 winged helix DNA-binding domain-containing protein [Chloroflexota bacterium]
MTHSTMPIIDLKRLTTHRTRTFGLPPAKPLSSPSQALTFVNKRGFVYFWPIKGIDLPNLWMAAAGNRPVADAHDDPGHVTWRWKDDALPKRIWYYAKILRRKATMISLDVVPYFYALSRNYGSPEEDHIIAYEEGRLTLAAKNIYDALLKEGALDSISLRKAARMTSAKESEWNRALEDLQMDFKILPVGVAEAGAWKYAFIYQITARHYPDLPEKARVITESQARTKLLELYFESVGAAQARDVNKLFGWGNDLSARAITKLMESGKLKLAEHPKQKGEWLALSLLCSR